MARRHTIQDTVQEVWQLLNEERRDDVMDALRDSIMEMLTLTREQLVKGYPIICKSCAKKHIYDIPVQVADITNRMKALQAFQEMGEGAPAQVQQLDVNVLVAHTLAELNGKTNEELAAMIGAEEAEWAELPPAA